MSMGKHGYRCLENCPPNRYGADCVNECKCEHNSYCHSEKGCQQIGAGNSHNKKKNAGLFKGKFQPSLFKAKLNQHKHTIL